MARPTLLLSLSLAASLCLAAACSRSSSSSASPLPSASQAAGPPRVSLAELTRSHCLAFEPSIARSCYAPDATLSHEERRRWAQQIVAMPPSPRRAALIRSIAGDTVCSAPDCTREVLLGVFHRSMPRDDEGRQRWLEAWCLSAPTPDALLVQCLSEPMPERSLAALLQAAGAASPATRSEARQRSAEAIVDQPEGPARDEMLRLLALSPQARLPGRTELDRRAAELLRARGLDPAELCEGDLRLAAEQPPGTLRFAAEGQRCVDGFYIEAELASGPGGWRLLRARRLHNN